MANNMEDVNHTLSSTSNVGIQQIKNLSASAESNDFLKHSKTINYGVSSESNCQPFIIFSDNNIYFY